MRKVIKKWFWAWDFEKEEKWLNEMSAKGLALVDYTFCRYSFEECEPGEYSFKIQYLENKPSHPESEQYIRFMEETGAEQIANFSTWIYFRKKTSEGPFEIFSDYESKIKHLNLIKSLFLTVGIANLIVAIGNFINFVFNAPMLAWIPLINVFCFGACVFGTYKIGKKIAELKKEQSIHE